MSRYETPAEEQPTPAELAAEETLDPLAGMVPCRHRCGAYFHGPDSTAARRHYATAHHPEENPQA